MAKLASVDVRVGEDHDDVIAWYRSKLAEPATFPWTGTDWTPVRAGPTWQTTADGHWLLPEATLGWDALGWCGTELQLERNVPWRFTLEQARFLLWWYAVDERGRWVVRDGVLQRLKGWGKDPFGGCLIYNEMLGPCRFAGWDGDTPVATDNPKAWVQMAAVSLEQTKNTMTLMPSLITPAAKEHYGVRVGKELIYAYDDERFAQAVTSSPATLEGARASLVLKNETHHWNSSNGGHDMAAVIERNATKSADGAARTLAITNAPEPGEDSVAERDWDAFEKMQAGKQIDTGLVVDSLEAPPDAPLAPPQIDGETADDYRQRTVELVSDVIVAVRGDSVWLDPERIVQSILDPRNPPSRSRRFWYNQRVAAEDAWLEPAAVDRIAVTSDGPDSTVVVPADRIALFFDGSKSDDATGLAGCRISDGHVLTLGVWQKPAGAQGEGWIVDRQAVDRRVREVLAAGKVAAFYADPSHTKDDDLTGFWDGIIDGWHRDFGAKLEHWAVKSGDGKHSIMWDMTSPARSAQFADAARTFVEEAESDPPLMSFDGHPAMRQHMLNARTMPTRWGASLGKEHRESPRKIDLAVCAVGARMLRRIVLNNPKRSRSGAMWGL